MLMTSWEKEQDMIWNVSKIVFEENSRIYKLSTKVFISLTLEIKKTCYFDEMKWEVSTINKQIQV